MKKQVEKKDFSNDQLKNNKPSVPQSYDKTTD